MATEAEYVLYHGDEFIAIGTAEELAEKQGVAPETIKFYATPAYARRDTGQNRFIAVKITKEGNIEDDNE